MSSTPQRIICLDGWRALAIGLVIFFHCLPMGNENRAWLGHLGVDIFFGLSGYLITALLLAEHEQAGEINLKAFYRRRIFRILPPALVYLAIVGLAGLYKSGWEVAACLFFFRNYLPDARGSYITIHLWSLAVEEHFYMLWPGALVLVGIKKMTNWISYAAFAIAFWRIWGAADLSFAITGVPELQRTDFRLDSLLWGCAVAFIMQHPPSRARLAATLRPWTWALMALAVIIPNVISHSQNAALAPLLIIATVTTPLLIPFILAGTVLHPQWLLSRFLELPLLRWMGRLSYSLYIWQELFLLGGKFHAASVWVNLASTLIAACISYYLIEKPCIAWGRRQSYDTRRKLDVGIVTTV